MSHSCARSKKICLIFYLTHPQKLIFNALIFIIRRGLLFPKSLRLIGTYALFPPSLYHFLTMFCSMCHGFNTSEQEIKTTCCQLSLKITSHRKSWLHHLIQSIAFPWPLPLLCSTMLLKLLCYRQAQTKE